MADDDYNYNLNPIIVGICAMDTKAKSKAMRAILQRLEKTNYFKIIIFGNDMIFNQSVKDWPKCDCFISFYSSGFPLDKATQYSELNRHRMFIVNDLGSQRLLLDRRLVCDILRLHSINVPNNLIISRDGLPSYPYNIKSPGLIPDVKETQDELIVNNTRLSKPFVEKPTKGDDHNIYIYYHSKDGGGSRRLFRKVNNKSSEKYPNCSTIRNNKNESYIYEEFIKTNIIPSDKNQIKQRDLKVYSVGEYYSHAEARKSPEVDGKVERLPDGREVRHILQLTKQEQLFASCIVRCFKQRVCGFDVLRKDKGDSYVCDVNGWSFVKGNDQYYDKCGELLTNMFLTETKKIRNEYPTETAPLTNNWKLRGIVGVIRHADRTPKQKVKLKVTHPKILALFTRLDKEVKMKSDKNQKELSNLLSIITDILNNPLNTPGNIQGIEGHDCRVRLQLICTVLSNLYQGLKIQIKPYQIDKSCNPPILKRALMVCKWGGMLTEKGEIQAWRLGKYYRTNVICNDINSRDMTYYLNPPPKISSNNERRVKRTAELFGSGFLDKDINDNPYVYDNSQTNHMLGDINDAKDEIDKMKTIIHNIIHASNMNQVKDYLTNCGVIALEEIARSNQDKNPFFYLLTDLWNYLKCVCLKLQGLIDNNKQINLHGETLPSMLQRWQRLTNYLYNEKTQQFDATKVPDVEDYVKYDIIHNRELFGDNVLIPLYSRAKVLADFIVPREYGILPKDKLKIGYQTCKPLCNEIIGNITDMIESENVPSVYLTFTSESHVHPLLNFLLHSKVVPMKSLDFFTELNYLTQVIFKVYEDTDKHSNDPERFIIQLFYSYGVIGDALACIKEDNKILPVVPAICINKGVTLDQLKEIFIDSIVDL